MLYLLQLNQSQGKMFINKKAIITIGLLSLVVFTSMVSLNNNKPAKEKLYKNLKVLPKNITKQQLHDVMEEWEHALGTKCSFCHERDTATRKMNWASDAKPEKEMARKMYKMTEMLNKKYFHAKKNEIGMMAEEGVNCNSCHRGQEHPEVTPASKKEGH
ncbi:MAG: c-type cytochrome [Sphingobacteriaceae bacterium]|nr:MAG: c-type cytochrome [Sphingobacteriaceae bacterium]